MTGLLSEGLTQWQSWLLLAFVLGIAEIVMPGIFLIWVALAAAVTGVLTLLVPMSVPVQLVLFAVLCIVAFYAGRRIYVRSPGDSADPLLNDRTARLVGEVGLLAAAIANGRGRVKIGDTEWPCKGPDLPEGTPVRITGAQGSLLLVERATVA